MKCFALIVVSLVVLIVLVVLIIGLLQPAKHSVTRSIHLKQTPESVFAVIEDQTNSPGWSSGIAKVEPLPDRDGKPSMRCTLKWGNMQMIVTQLERTPPSRLVFEMSKEGGPTFGTWTYNISPEADECRVAITEDGELKNPFYHTMARMRGLDANIRQMLSDLAKKFGEMPDIQTKQAR
jgi:hypothetical protein